MKGLKFKNVLKNGALHKLWTVQNTALFEDYNRRVKPDDMIVCPSDFFDWFEGGDNFGCEGYGFEKEIPPQETLSGAPEILEYAPLQQYVYLYGRLGHSVLDADFFKTECERLAVIWDDCKKYCLKGLEI